jgi:hypothetical protein
MDLMINQPWPDTMEVKPESRLPVRFTDQYKRLAVYRGTAQVVLHPRMTRGSFNLRGLGSYAQETSRVTQKTLRFLFRRARELAHYP